MLVCDEYFFQVYQALSTKTIIVNDCINFIVVCMELIDKSVLTGPQKSASVINTLSLMVTDKYDECSLFISPIVLRNIKLLIDNDVIQDVMNGLFNASKGQFKIANFNVSTNKRNVTVEISPWGSSMFGKYG